MPSYSSGYRYSEAMDELPNLATPSTYNQCYLEGYGIRIMIFFKYKFRLHFQNKSSQYFYFYTHYRM